MKYKKTELGRQTFKDRNVSLSPRQRSALILVDGEKDDSDIFKALSMMGLGAEDMNFLLEAGLIEEASPSGAKAAPPPAWAPSTAIQADTAELPALSEQARYKNAYPIAVKLTAGLGFRGIRLNMSVESAGSYKELMVLAPKIRDAVGEDKFAELAHALDFQ